MHADSRVWIERPLEKKYARWLEAPHFRLYTITGAGGRGKSSLLKRLMLHTADSKPWMLLNLPEQPNIQTMLELLMYAPHDGTTKFAAINQALQKVSDKLLTAYQPSLDNAISLLDKTTDNTSYGVWVDTALGLLKLGGDYINKSAKEKEEYLQQNAELALWNAFIEDVQKKHGGLLLIDTYELASASSLQTKLEKDYKDDIISRPKSKPVSFHAILEMLLEAATVQDVPLCVVVAGRGSIRQQFRNINRQYVAAEEELSTFDNAAIAAYCAQYFVSEPQPSAAHIAAMHDLTKGNPLLVELLVHAITVEGENYGGWDWAHWQELAQAYKAANELNEYGLIYYLTEHILQRIPQAKEQLWKLVLPLRLYSELAPLLFPKPDPAPEGTLWGEDLFAAYVQQGIMHRVPLAHMRSQRATSDAHLHAYAMHAEVKAALNHYARAKGHWRSQEARDTHARLMRYFDNLSYWQQDKASRLVKPAEDKPRFGRREAAYHGILSMDDAILQTRYPHSAAYVRANKYSLIEKLEAESFWYVISASLGSTPNITRATVEQVLTEQLEDTELIALLTLFAEEYHLSTKFLREDTLAHVRTEVSVGNYPNDFMHHAWVLEALLKMFGADAGVHNLYAVFLSNIRGDYDKAAAHYRQALEIDSGNAKTHGNYACYLDGICEDYTKAEKHYLRALELDEGDAYTHGSYAHFLDDIRRDYDKAEKHYLQSLELDVWNAKTHSNYASFLKNIRRDYDKAEKHYLRSLELDARNANTHGNYANFLYYICDKYDKAEAHYLRSLELDAESVIVHSNYALFLYTIRGNHNKAEAHYLRSLELDEGNANTHGNYALFLKNIRGDYDKAEAHYLRALELDESNATTHGNYASFLFSRQQDAKAVEHWQEALACNPQYPSLLCELWFYAYAHMSQAKPQALTELKQLLQQGARSPQWDLTQNIARAKQAGHPNFALLCALAEVISNGTDLSSLAEYPAWQQA